MCNVVDLCIRFSNYCQPDQAFDTLSDLFFYTLQKVEVRLREGRAVNIHMFCARRPGLLLSAMRAVEGLGLDVQQAVISCFNGFTLDIFKAEVMHKILCSFSELAFRYSILKDSGDGTETQFELTIAQF